MADVGSFLEGLNEGLAPWAEAQARHRYARDERVAAAAFIKAQDKIKSAEDIAILAESYAPDNKEEFSNALTKWAGGKSALTKLLRQDQLNGGKLVFSDTPVKGGYNLFGPAWRMAPPTDALRNSQKLILDTATGISFANRMIKEGKNPHTINDWLKFSLEQSGESIPENAGELELLHTKHLSKLLPLFQGYVKGGLKENETSLIKSGALDRDLLGNYIQASPQKQKEMLSILMPNLEKNAASILRTANKEQTGSSISNLWGLFDDDEPTSRESLALSGSEQKAVSYLLAQIKGKRFSAGNSRTIVRGFIDATPSLSGLPTDRKEDIQKLLETLLNEQKAVK